MVGTYGAANYQTKYMDANVQVQTWTYRLSKPKTYPNAQKKLNEWKQRQTDYCTAAQQDKNTVVDPGTGPGDTFVEPSKPGIPLWGWLAGGALVIGGLAFFR